MTTDSLQNPFDSRKLKVNPKDRPADALMLQFIAALRDGDEDRAAAILAELQRRQWSEMAVIQ